MENINTKYSLSERIRRKRNRKCYYTVSVLIASIVVFCTVYALILIAITMEKEQKVLDCPLSIHQHTEQCYDADKNLICGEADFVIHTHDESCYNDNGSLVCKLPEINEHKHNKDCYDENGKLICKQPEVEAHKHSDKCYDNNGVLICGKLQTTEHIHGSACFKEVKSTSDSASKNKMMMLSSTNNRSSAATGGYYNDGSIWWGNLEVTQIPASAIQENTPYVITGSAGNNLISDETYTKENFSYLKAIPKENMTSFDLYQRWCFEKVNEDGSYYIYFLKDNKDGSTTKLYLQFAGKGVVEWGKDTQQTALTDDKTKATVFNVSQCQDSSYADHIIISKVIDGKTFYLNSYFGDQPASQNRTTHWMGYPEDPISAGSYLRVCQYTPQHTAQRVKTDKSSNSVINLFDYWIAPNQTDADNVDPTEANNLRNSGINKGHDFKFSRGQDALAMNTWTGENALPLQGIVANVLDKNGYPTLSGNSSVNGTESTESLEYLFKPQDKNNEPDGKKSYRDVSGLLTLDSEDFYAFDCNKNMAEFNEEKNNIYIYDKPGVTGSGDIGQFFPFNKAPQIMTARRDNSAINHYFGMTITTRFIQKHGGHVDVEHKTPTTFHFSGDDDVWIFIDGVLVGDVGGIHDASTVDIDFSTGNVKVAVASHPETYKETITLKECYKAAGRENSVLWNGDTFEDNTTHTLKFFYLERGNYASNLTLRYNMTEIPRTGINKVNEYGDPLAGARFAVYPAADESYKIIGTDGKPIINMPDKVSYDDNGNLLDSSGKVLANSLYTGVTNEDGALEFLDQDNMPYTINELNELFGQYFILREISAPTGYRFVSKEVHLEIWQSGGQRVLRCRNINDSGSRATTNLQITATDIIHLRRDYKGIKGKTEIQYCDPTTGDPTGTLFAVVCKYTGDLDNDGNIKDEASMAADESWTPVYGSDEQGYHLINMNDEGNNRKDILTASIEAAQKALEYDKHDGGGVIFTKSNNSTMRLEKNNLPGSITSYYSLLSDREKFKTKYTVAYYWTDQPSIDLATPDNTYGVNTYAFTTEDTIYSGFDRIFGADIQVPNLLNDVYVQKVDENNKRINGANFALYKVQQDENSGVIRYYAKSADGNYSYIPLSDDAVIDPDTGNIKQGNYTITRTDFGTSKDLGDGIHDGGTVRFKNLADGQYIIKEVKAPQGYKLNTSDAMVLVKEDTIYANAGTENDGIAVGRGPGYLVEPLDEYASEGEIDNTLTWIYAQMRISQPSTRFADVGNEDKIQGYLTESFSSKVGTESAAARTYLKYTSENVDKAFNYKENTDRTVENGAQNPIKGERRLFTTVGWPYYEVYQDTSYGSDIVKDTGINYTKIPFSQITNLFSRSSYIRFTDTNDVTLKLKKVDSANKNVPLSDAEFRLYRLNSDKQKEYYVRDDTGKVSWNTDINAAKVITTGTDGMSTENFTQLTDGTFYLEEIKAPSEEYCILYQPVEVNIEFAKMTINEYGGSSVDDGELINNLYTYTITVPNSTGYELPATGGSGTNLYTAGGILLLSISLVFGYRKKRRSERRFE